MAATDRVCVGVIGGVHGVRGIVKVKPFTADPADVVAYGPLTDASGRRVIGLKLLSKHKGQWLARVDGVDDRNAAEALRGTELYVDRGRLPAADEDEFYHADLIGLTAVGTDGQAVGTVRAVHDFGAGDILEIVGAGGPPLMLPFTREAVPEIDLSGRRLVIDPPAETEAKPQDDPERGTEGGGT